MKKEESRLDESHEFDRDVGDPSDEDFAQYRISNSEKTERDKQTNVNVQTVPEPADGDPKLFWEFKNGAEFEGIETAWDRANSGQLV